MALGSWGFSPTITHLLHAASDLLRFSVGSLSSHPSQAVISSNHSQLDCSCSWKSFGLVPSHGTVVCSLKANADVNKGGGRITCLKAVWDKHFSCKIEVYLPNWGPGGCDSKQSSPSFVQGCGAALGNTALKQMRVSSV